MRTHYKISFGHPVELDGKTDSAACGAEVANAEMVIACELLERGIPIFDWRDCRKCVEKIYEAEATKERAWVSGIVNGEEYRAKYGNEEGGA